MLSLARLAVAAAIVYGVVAIAATSAGATNSAYQIMPANSDIFMQPLHLAKGVNFAGTVDGGNVRGSCLAWYQTGGTPVDGMSFPLGAPNQHERVNCYFTDVSSSPVPVTFASSGWVFTAKPPKSGKVSFKAVITIPKDGIVMTLTDGCVVTFAPSGASKVSGTDNGAGARGGTDWIVYQSQPIPVAVSAGCTASATFAMTTTFNEDPGMYIAS